MVNYKGLRNILAERGISFRQLARETGLTSNCTSALNNDRPVSIEKLAIICRYLNVHLSDIVDINDA